VPQQLLLDVSNTSHLPLQFTWSVQQLQCKGRQQLLQHGSCDNDDLATQGSDAPAGVQDGDDSRESTAEPAAVASSSHTQLQIIPQSGKLQPGEQQQLRLLLEPQAVGAMQLLCCCEVPGMKQLVGFQVATYVEGLQVKYDVLKGPELCTAAGSVTLSSSSSSSSKLTGSAGSTPPARQGRLHAASSKDYKELHDVQSREVAAAAGVQSPVAGSTPAAEATTDLLIDYGVVGIHEVSEVVLRVSNLTSIGTKVQAWVGRFFAASQAIRPSAGAALLDVAAAADEKVHCEQQQQQHLTVLQPAPGTRHASYSPLPDSAAAAAGSGATAVRMVQLQQQHSSAAVATQAAKSSNSSIPSSASRSGRHLSGKSAVQGTVKHAGIASKIALKSSGAAGPLVEGPFRAAAGSSIMANRHASAISAAALGSSSLGCAVEVTPQEDVLTAWGRCDLHLVAHNNLPGSYVDCLHVKVQMRTSGQGSYIAFWLLSDCFLIDLHCFLIAKCHCCMWMNSFITSYIVCIC
jgi:hypothetical protein